MIEVRRGRKLERRERELGFMKRDPGQCWLTNIRDACQASHYPGNKGIAMEDNQGQV